MTAIRTGITLLDSDFNTPRNNDTSENSVMASSSTPPASRP